jgi:hypothetical protein
MGQPGRAEPADHPDLMIEIGVLYLDALQHPRLERF